MSNGVMGFSGEKGHHAVFFYGNNNNCGYLSGDNLCTNEVICRAILVARCPTFLVLVGFRKLTNSQTFEAIWVDMWHP